MPKLDDLYAQLHEKLIRELLARIESGEAKPADLAVARQMLRDNDITSIPVEGSPLQNLVHALPFSGDGDETHH